MSDIPTIYSLRELHDYLIEYPHKRDIFIFFDFDLNLIDDEKDTLLEPEVTKELFQYLRDNKIYHCILTARFYETVCHKNHREPHAMDENIKYYIHPILEELGLDTSYHSEDVHHNDFTEFFNEKGECVGVEYRGIFFGDKKGEIIKSYLKVAPFKRNHIIFVDDYEPYLENVKTHMPSVLSIRRNYDNFV